MSLKPKELALTVVIGKWKGTNLDAKVANKLNQSMSLKTKKLALSVALIQGSSSAKLAKD